MDVQADAALEVMAETPSPAGGAAASFASLSTPTPASPNGSSQKFASLPVGAASGFSSPQRNSSQAPQHGYPKEISVKPVEEKFLCGYCENILREPLQSQCGHRFCSCCRVTMSQLPQPVICQACIKEDMPEESSVLTLNDMFEDKAAIREMRKIPVKCINPGCSWTGLFTDYITTHEKSCDKKMVSCPLCGALMSQKKLDNHMNKLCPKRRVSCRYCGQEMLQEQEAKHQATCPMVPIKCHKCSTLVPRNEIQNHQERDCIHRDIICPVPDCRKKMSKEQFSSHLSESPKMAQKHMFFLFEKTNQLEAELAHLRAEAETPRVQAVAGASEGASARGQHEASMEDSRSADQQGATEAVGGAESAATAISAEQASDTLKMHEDLMGVLHGEILRCIRQVEALTLRRSQDARDSQTKLQALERTLGTVEVRLQELRVSHLLTSTEHVGSLVESGDGVATWSIPGFTQLRRAAVNGQKEFIESPPFTTGSLGYKLKMRLFPDGDGEEKGQALSLYVVLLPGDGDDLLPWPFQADVHFALVDLKEFKHHRTASIHSPKTEPSCRRPSPNGQSPGFGITSLLSLNEMGSNLSRYSLRDTVYLRAIVDTRDCPIQLRLRGLDPRLNPGLQFRREERAQKK